MIFNCVLRPGVSGSYVARSREGPDLDIFNPVGVVNEGSWVR